MKLTWQNTIYSNASKPYISNPEPEIGDEVKVSIRMLKESPVTNVILSYLKNGDEQLTEMEKYKTDNIFKYYICGLEVQQPIIQYHFRIYTSQNRYYYNRSGITTYNPTRDYDFKIMTDHHLPEWIKSAVFYQIMPDGKNLNNVFTNSLLVTDKGIINGNSGTEHLSDLNQLLYQEGYISSSDNTYHREAVKKLQEDLGVSQDGIWGNNTRMAYKKNKGYVTQETELGYASRTVFGEARGADDVAKLAVAEVLQNRVKGSTYSDTLEGVATDEKQFSCWNESSNTYRAVINPEGEDDFSAYDDCQEAVKITNGNGNYSNVSFTKEEKDAVGEVLSDCQDYAEPDVSNNWTNDMDKITADEMKNRLIRQGLNEGKASEIAGELTGTFSFYE